MKTTRLLWLLPLLVLSLFLSLACSSDGKSKKTSSNEPPAASTAPSTAGAGASTSATGSEAPKPKDPFETAEVGKNWVVGKGTVDDMNVIFYMEEPKPDMIGAHGQGHMKDGTHHFEVKVFDKNPPFDSVPYVDISAVLRHQESKKEMKFDVKPMLGGWFHYGDDVKLAEKGKWDATLKINGVNVPRYARKADKFSQKGELKFIFDYK